MSFSLLRRSVRLSRPALAFACALGVALTAAPALGRPDADGVRLRRVALMIGVNDGGPTRPRLRYAASDARSVARVLEHMGGLAGADLVFVNEASRAAVLAGFGRVRAIAGAGKPAGARTELVLYYSGHSDDEGLLVGGDRIGYDELRAQIQAVPADVRVAILDSCASGAFTRRKGGMRRPPFMMDASADMRGHAFLASSAASEVAQESDRIAASFFTHYLVTGLRGAADVNADRRVTLQEAFQFASAETLARTERTRGGPQHAAYEFDLAGTGDFVVTDVRSTQAGLVLGPELGGRISIRDAAGVLVAELRKPSGRAVELGLEAGSYQVAMAADGASFQAQVSLSAGQRAELSKLAFRPGPALELAQARGDEPGAAAGAPAATLVAPLAAVPRRTTALHLTFIPEDPVPAIDVQGGLSFGIIGTRVARMRGLQLALGLTRADEELRGVQLSVGANIAKGDVSGAQITSGVNWVEGRFRGVQIASIADLGRADFRGAQLASVVAWNQGLTVGAQIAGVVAASSGPQRGAQIAGVAALADAPQRGAQIAGVATLAPLQVGLQLAPVNVAGESHGAQIGVVNVSGAAAGFSLGVVNVTGRARGFGLGVVNVAGHHDGEVFGLINIIGNGIKDATVFTTDALIANAGLKLGGRHLYTLLSIGYTPGDELADGSLRFVRGSRRIGTTVGIGWRFGLPSDRVPFLELEASHTQLRSEWSDGETPLIAALRAQVGLRLGPARLLAGAGVNVSVGWNGQDADLGLGLPEHVTQSGETTVRIYPGFLLGAQI